MTQTTTLERPSTTPRCEPQSPPPVAPSPFFRWKGIFDRSVALALLIPAIPAILFLMLLVRITSPGRGIYRQLRVGRGGRTFFLYKIRTMRKGAEDRTGPVWCSESDPRITRVGGVLRTLHLDELPQLWNVVKGDMALIGPRPERPEFTQWLAKKIPRYLDRLSVRPGVTGLAQIRLPADTDIDGVRRKLLLDLKYVETATLSADVRIAFCTALKMLGLPVRGLVNRMFVDLPALPEPSLADAGSATCAES